jgi:hypothetical protein
MVVFEHRFILGSAPLRQPAAETARGLTVGRSNARQAVGEGGQAGRRGTCQTGGRVRP